MEGISSVDKLKVNNHYQESEDTCVNNNRYR